MHKLFAFYGSLRLNEYNYNYLIKDKPGVEYVTTSTVNGYTLHSLGSYPVILPTEKENNGIVIDVFSIDNSSVENRIRSMELGADYEEKLIDVEGLPDKVTIYIGGKYYKENATRLPEVPHGDWVKRK